MNAVLGQTFVFLEDLSLVRGCVDFGYYACPIYLTVFTYLLDDYGLNESTKHSFRAKFGSLHKTRKAYYHTPHIWNQ